MNTVCYDLAPRFHGALKAIFENNILENVTVKVTSACITLYYAIKTELKDRHRRVLKNDYCETCVGTVVNEVTFMKAVFGFDTAMVYINGVFSRIKSFTLELSKNLNVNEAIRVFLNRTQEKI